VSYDAAAIRLVITQVLQGTAGTLRVVAPGQFLAGVHGGQTDLAQRSRANRHIAGEVVHRFDVKLGRLKDHVASPSGALGPYRLCVLPIEINVLTHTKSVVRDDARDALLAELNSDLDTALQALHCPGNLSFTAAPASAPTGIVSGMLLGAAGEGAPDAEITEESWDKNLLRSRISGGVLVEITQVTT
jgi:hypothetical protein